MKTPKISANQGNRLLKITVILFLYLFSGKLIWADSSAQDWYNQSVKAAKREAYTEALKHITEALKKEPRNDLYLAYQSHLFRLTGQFLQGQAAAEQALSLNNRVAWYYVSGALNSYYAGDWTSAEKFLDSLGSFSAAEIGKENMSMIRWVKDQLRERIYELSFVLDPKFGIRKNDLLYFSVPSSWPPRQLSEVAIEGINIVRMDKTPGDHVYWISDTNKVFKMTARIVLTPTSFKSQFSSLGKEAAYPPEIASYLESSDRINIRSSLVLQKAEEIKNSFTDSRGANSVEITAIRSIISWLEKNMEYKIDTFKTIDELITRGQAECGGYSALFVGFCRAMGIPAREAWGVIEASAEFAPEGFMKGHAWAEVFLTGIGWVPVDPQIPWTLGQLPPSYIRICHYNREHSLIDFENYRPNGNLARLMWQEPWGDIVAFKRRQ